MGEMRDEQSLTNDLQDARERDINHWSEFVNRFFSQKGIYRTNLLHKKQDEENTDRQVEMVAAALPHYFNASGAKKIELQLGQGTTHKPIPGLFGDNYYIENQNASLTMWFPDSHVCYSYILTLSGPWLISSESGCTLWHAAYSIRS